MRLFNQLLDRTLKGKSVAIVNSQRAYNKLGGKIMPRAIAVFPVVSINVIKPLQLESLDDELCYQLASKAEKAKSMSHK